MINALETDYKLSSRPLSKNKLLIALVVLPLFFSQFYTWRSGLPQIAHIISLVAMLFYAISYRYIYVRNFSLLILFTSYVFIVNLVWFIIFDLNLTYVWSTTYWLYNLILIVLLYNASLKDKNTFISWTLKTILFSYIIEVILWILGAGRYDFAPRYNGFFNDPNQMAFWVLATCSIYLFLSKNKFYSLLVYSLAVILIIITLSRSALLGIPLLTLGLIAKQEGSFIRKLTLSFLLLLVVSIGIFIFYNLGYFDETISRFTEGLEQKDSQSEGRGFNILLDNPEHLFFGAGQGNYDEYSTTGHEIHSTWLGVLFYYGLLGLSILIAFLYKITKQLTLAEKMLFLAPMMYGFTTYSIRTTAFWFVIAAFMLPQTKSSN